MITGIDGGFSVHPLMYICTLKTSVAPNDSDVCQCLYKDSACDYKDKRLNKN